MKAEPSERFATLNERCKALQALVADDGHELALNALISALATRAYGANLQRPVAANLRKLAQVMEQYGSREALQEVARANEGRIPTPRLEQMTLGRIPVPDEVPTAPEGYSAEDVQATTQLVEKLSVLLEGQANHVALSVLLSVYMNVAEYTGDTVRAAQYLVHTGLTRIEQATAQREPQMPAPASGTFH